MTSPRGHDGRGDIYHVAFQPDGLPGTRTRGLVQARFPAGGLDQPWGPGRFLSPDDCPGPVLLGRERCVVMDGPLAGGRPHRPPGARVHGRIPDGFGTQIGVVLVRVAGPGVSVSISCPSLKASPCQRKCEARSLGAFVIRNPTTNRKFASSSSRKLPAESIPASSTTTISARPWRD